MRITLPEPGQTYQRDLLAHPRLPFGSRNPAFAQAEFDVLLNREPRKQRIFLEHDAAIGTRFEDRLSIDPHLAAAGLFESRDDVQQRCLSTTARTEHGEELVVGDLQVDAIKRNNLLSACYIGKPLA